MTLLKKFPADFLVSESLVLPTTAPGAAGTPYHYVRLRKRGYTTFEAIDTLSAFCDLDAREVGYAGLKDEDAITDQLISLTGPLTLERIEAFNTEHGAGEHQQGHPPFLMLRHHGYGPLALGVGELDGNSFHIVVRHLNQTQAERLDGIRGRRSLYFVNYYDTQRFGVPTGPKRTHLIGQALLDGDHGRALELVRESGSAEATAARRFTGPAAEFFSSLDQRRVAFFLSSHASAAWNRQVSDLVRTNCADAMVREVREGIPYLFPTTADGVLAVLRDGLGLRYDSWRWRDGQLTSSPSARPAAVQTQVRVGEVTEDESASGAWRCTLKFFLGSGSYGTTAVGQFFHQLQAVAR
ncbi:tRNA pseudouridine(13) synthase TruD [Streptomyces sp. NPDC056149]|uniref:tRNA pseudouridine(13) synthase TruD n=1 Tax=unclassified Streptomyces TaxID=2593676 RepID=UPI002380E644|nr:tRNA pseudouridine(13) synthase TruD [Streptomyces sp. WZ-12]